MRAIETSAVFRTGQTTGYIFTKLAESAFAPHTMPNLDPQRRKSDDARGALTGHRCKLCREALLLVRTRVSPPRLGPALITEFYQCRACDSGYAHSPATGAWKPWAADES